MCTATWGTRRMMASYDMIGDESWGSMGKSRYHVIFHREIMGKYKNIDKIQWGYNEDHQEELS